MPSADFCAAVRSPCGDLSLVAETQRRSPEVRPTAFAARPPDLPPRPLMTLDFAIICPLVRPGRPRYPVLVHRAAALLHASFRPHLVVTPLRFANPSPPSGWIEDSHLQAVDHARHTKEKRAGEARFSQPTIRLSWISAERAPPAPRASAALPEASSRAPHRPSDRSADHRGPWRNWPAAAGSSGLHC
jgi:hypothetical protein